MTEEKDRGPEIWKTLVAHLRKLNPEQKIKLAKAYYSYSRDVVIDGTAVPVSLNQEHTSGGFRHIRLGRYYFTIGDWSRHRARARAIEGKKGFDWGRVAQLVEAERLYVVAKQIQESESERVEKLAKKQLAELLKRRRDLREVVEQYVEIAHGKFGVEVNGMSVTVLERVLDAAKLAEVDDG